MHPSSSSSSFFLTSIYGSGLIPAPAVLEVGSDKIWALLVLSELFGLRAVSAQCSQRLARLCKAEGPIDVSRVLRLI